MQKSSGLTALKEKITGLRDWKSITIAQALERRFPAPARPLQCR